MRRLTAVTPLLAATALLGAPASAHPSMSMFDRSKQIGAWDPEVAKRYQERVAK